MALNHYSTIPSGFNQDTSVEKQPLLFDRKKFRNEFDPWFFTLIVSLLPFLIVFLFFRGPIMNFAFLEFFNDNALLYIFVTMSALSLYTYGMKNLIGVMHFYIMVLCMVVYFLLRSNVSIPLFDIFDRRKFIAWLLLISVLLGSSTLVYSSVKKGET